MRCGAAIPVTSPNRFTKPLYQRGWASCCGSGGVCVDHVVGVPSFACYIAICLGLPLSFSLPLLVVLVGYAGYAFRIPSSKP